MPSIEGPRPKAAPRAETSPPFWAGPQTGESGQKKRIGTAAKDASALPKIVFVAEGGNGRHYPSHRIRRAQFRLPAWSSTWKKGFGPGPQ